VDFFSGASHLLAQQEVARLQAASTARSNADVQLVRSEAELAEVGKRFFSVFFACSFFCYGAWQIFPSTSTSLIWILPNFLTCLCARAH
jgi:hypothetical protein